VGPTVLELTLEGGNESAVGMTRTN
jgi:hypothetical protein